MNCENVVHAVQDARLSIQDSPSCFTSARMPTHLLVELWQAPFSVLANALEVEKAISLAGRDSSPFESGFGVEVKVHQFEPYGVSGAARTSSAHIVIHTWPEKGYAALDIYAINRESAYRVLDEIEQGLLPERVQITELDRGHLLDVVDT